MIRHSGARTLYAAAAVLAVSGLVGSAWGLINLKITPVELVKAARQVAALKASAPEKNQLRLHVEQVIRGDKFAADDLAVDLTDTPDAVRQDLDEAFGKAKSVPGAILTSRVAGQPGGKAPAAVVEIGTKWFTLFALEGGKYRLDADKQDLSAIWGGSGRTFAQAAARVVEDPKASFPTLSTLKWGGEKNLGTIPGKVHASLTIDLGEKRGPCLLVLADGEGGGDRLYKIAAGNLTDITAEAQLKTASTVATTGDFDGDGRMDLAVCDAGGTLRLALQTAEGTFRLMTPDAKVPGCVSLSTLDAGGRAAILAGTAKGPVLLTADAGGAWKAAPLPMDSAALASLGAGGVCAVADFTRRGGADVVACFTNGYVLFAAEKPGTYKPGVKVELKLPESPSAVVMGDFDADGALDLVVSGHDGTALLAGGALTLATQPASAPAATPATGPVRFTDITADTGELAYHGNLNDPEITAATLFDVNGDGRQGLALLCAKGPPRLFFNRGFACFGLARELTFQESNLKAGPALENGQAAGAILTTDGVPSLFCVDTTGTAWLLEGRRSPPGGGSGPGASAGIQLVLSPKAHGPLTVTVSRDKHITGMVVVRPGMPVWVGTATPGALTLTWKNPDGAEQTKPVFVRAREQVVIP